MEKKHLIRVRVNGRWQALEVTGSDLLVDILRDRMGLTGTKKGCGKGDCGACTVLLDNLPVNSCLVLAVQTDGKEVLTIEGLREKTLHSIQKAFFEHGAIQCGYCTPGIILSTKVLLDANPRPSEVEIERAISGNLCRCTGYVQIIEAIKSLQTEREDEGLIGPRGGRVDTLDKVTGKAQYAGDLSFPHMVYAKALFSQKPHARIVSLDLTEAERLEGVIRVFTAQDIEGSNGFGATKPHQPILVPVGGVARFLGDTLALVVAEDEKIAQRAVELIRVEYEDLPGIFSIDEALRPNGLLIHPDAPGNICATQEMVIGDVEKGFNQSMVYIREESFVSSVKRHPMKIRVRLGASRNGKIQRPSKGRFSLMPVLIQADLLS